MTTDAATMGVSRTLLGPAWERLPWLAEYLELPPGSRFLVAPGYADVWRDERLLGG